MTIGWLEADATAMALADAADGTPVRPIRYELRKRAREYQHVARLLEPTADGEEQKEAVIELVGNVGAGMEVLMSGGVYWSVVRVMRRDGQVSLHLEHEDEPMPRYINLYGPTSPVVVRA